MKMNRFTEVTLVLLFAGILAYALAGCTHQQLTGLPAPGAASNEVEKIEMPKEPAKVIDAAGLRAKLFDMALNSSCAKSSHDEQGTPPKGYMKGIVSTYLAGICDPNQEWVKTASQPVGDASKDFLAHYGLKPQTASERLNMVFSLMVGSAARESSWRWCVGKDPGATNTSAETCEAGLYQTSYNSRSASPVLPKLYAEFKEYPARCFAELYKGSTTCSSDNLKNWGTGEGVTFQQMSKQCPGFATEYHAVMVRVNRTHYGPINKKKSEMKPACQNLFEQIRQEKEKNPDLCFAI